jgi:Zn-dependent peptidase ImmA (M78 family)
MQIDDQHLAAISKVLEFPEEYFVTPPPPPVDVKDLLFRAPVATTKTEKLYLAEFARSAGEVLGWLDGQHRLPPVKIPSLPSDTPIQRAAREARVSLSIAQNEPIEHVTHLAERAGIPVIMRGSHSNLALSTDSAVEVLNERHLGYSVRVGEHSDRPITVLRSNPSWERVRWTIAHEVGHVVLHGRSLPVNSEEQASMFASELLAPIGEIEKELPHHVTLASLTALKLKWGISLGALVIHLKHNNLIDAERFETLRKQLYTRTNSATGRTWGRDEPGWDAREIERPRLLSVWLERCIGFTAPPAVAQVSRKWPADLIGSMLSGQRRSSSNLPVDQPKSISVHGGQVVSLDEWRLRQA